MKNQFFSSFRIALILLFFITVSNCEKDEVNNEEQTKNTVKNKVQINTYNNVSTSVLEFIKTKTNNSYSVYFSKGSVRLVDTFYGSENETLGTVDTSKEIVVINETNTKHTFKVIDHDNDYRTITNLIIVETESSTYEYFVKYSLNDGVSIHDAEGNLDFSQFRGRIETFNSEGILIGDILIEDGSITSQTGQLSPCPDEPVDDTNTNTNDEPSDGNNTSSSSTSAVVPGSDTGSTSSPINNTGNGGWFASSDNDDCGLNWSYSNCGCGMEYADGHAQTTNPCCKGSALVVRDCNGNFVGRNANLPTMYRGNPVDPCNDGDVGVILDEEELCAMDDENFNNYYSDRSPFTVDMSDVRNSCETITTVENEKFMCVYNKLIKSPTFKNIFNNVFGESTNSLNVKFEIVDNLTHNGNTVNGLAIRESFTINNEGTLTNMSIKIKLNSELFNNKTPIEIAKTIIHECIHSYLYVKIIDCDQGTQLANINQSLFKDLINQYFPNNSCNQPQNQHDFMINYMLPTLRTVLSDIKNDIIPQNQQQYIENRDFYDYSQATNGPLISSTPFTWDDFYYYLSLRGLHNTNYFDSTVADDPVKFFLYQRYIATTGELSKNCN